MAAPCCALRVYLSRCANAARGPAAARHKPAFYWIGTPDLRPGLPSVVPAGLDKAKNPHSSWLARTCGTRCGRLEHARQSGYVGRRVRVRYRPEDSDREYRDTSRRTAQEPRVSAKAARTWGHQAGLGERGHDLECVGCRFSEFFAVLIHLVLIHLMYRSRKVPRV
jgi:hypothetical protein